MTWTVVCFPRARASRASVAMRRPSAALSMSARFCRAASRALRRSSSTAKAPTSSPALKRANAGDEVGALAVLDDLRKARDVLDRRPEDGNLLSVRPIARRQGRDVGFLRGGERRLQLRVARAHLGAQRVDGLSLRPHLGISHAFPGG